MSQPHIGIVQLWEKSDGQRSTLAHPTADLLGQGARTLRAWARTGRERRELSGLDDRMLADIGIGRADVERERGVRFWQPIAADLLEAGRQERLRVWLRP